MSKEVPKDLQVEEDKKYGDALKEYNGATDNELIVDSVEPEIQELPDNICNISTVFNRHGIPEVEAPEELLNDIPRNNHHNNQTHKHHKKKTRKQKTNGTAPKPKSIPTPTSNSDHSSELIKKPIIIDNDKILPISSLSPNQYNCIIKARVTNKSDIRSWLNSHGEGKVFNMNLCDESGEIRAIAFIMNLTNNFYNLIEIDKVYYISKFKLKIARKQFSILKNEYEIQFNRKTRVIPCSDKINLPESFYKFIPIERIKMCKSSSVIDVIGVCKDSSQFETFTAWKTNRELKKREVILVDRTHNSITLTLWGTKAENFNAPSQSVLAIRAAKVGEFHGGKYLSLSSSSSMILNPDISKAHRLRRWFDNDGKDEEFVSLSARDGEKYYDIVVSKNCTNSKKSKRVRKLEIIINIIDEGISNIGRLRKTNNRGKQLWVDW